MATISHKSNAIKMLAKQTKGLYTIRDSLEFFLEC